MKQYNFRYRKGTNMNLVISALFIAGFYVMGYQLILEGQWWVAVGLAFVTGSFLLAVKERLHKLKVFKTVDERRKLRKSSMVAGIVPAPQPLSEVEKLDAGKAIREMLEKGQYKVNTSVFDTIGRKSPKN